MNVLAKEDLEAGAFLADALWGLPSSSWAGEEEEEKGEEPVMCIWDGVEESKLHPILPVDGVEEVGDVDDVDGVDDVDPTNALQGIQELIHCDPCPKLALGEATVREILMMIVDTTRALLMSEPCGKFVEEMAVRIRSVDLSHIDGLFFRAKHQRPMDMLSAVRMFRVADDEQWDACMQPHIAMFRDASRDPVMQCRVLIAIVEASKQVISQYFEGVCQAWSVKLDKQKKAQAKAEADAFAEAKACASQRGKKKRKRKRKRKSVRQQRTASEERRRKTQARERAKKAHHDQCRPLQSGYAHAQLLMQYLTERVSVGGFL